MSEVVVVYSPPKQVEQWPVGTLLPASSPAVSRGVSRGMVVLPTRRDLVEQLQLGGFVLRCFGAEGWVYDGQAGLGCPTVLELAAGASRVHWAARVRPANMERSASGKLRLYARPGDPRFLSCGLALEQSPEEFASLPPEGVVFTGASGLNPTINGFLGLGLWGACRNVAVDWFAVSQQ